MKPHVEEGREGLPDGASYDRAAALYDRLVRSRVYNRLAWSTSPRDYEEFAAGAFADGTGPLLEAAAGSAAATAELHASSARESTLVDLSREMLERAGSRIAADPAGTPDGVRLIRADVLDLPFEPGTFDTVLALGAAHLFDDVAALRDALLEQLAPGGHLHLAGLVAETRRAGAYLRALHRAGEVAAPRTAAELRDELGVDELRVEGCMAFAVIDA